MTTASKAWALAARVAAALALALSLVAPSGATAAERGELCGKRGGWSATCKAPLVCEIRQVNAAGKIGVCVEEKTRACGGLQGADCAPDEYCDYAPDAQCGAADQTGVCRPRPEACTFEYRPVCGCDDQTYPNACAAHAEGVSVVREGACEACDDDDDTCEPAPRSCSYAGKTYEVGQTFPASDGCNTCRCDESGSVQCTLKLCACNYDDPRRTWSSKDPDQCRAILFACPSGSKPFFDSCGCGCERSAPAKCQVAGCSGQLCIEAGSGGGITTCEWRDEYACYRSATCAPQPNGRCGWSDTPELRRCLANGGGARR